MTDVDAPLTPPLSARREFIGRLGMAAAGLAGSASLGPLWEESSGVASADLASRRSPWDMSWVDTLASAQYKVVFDGTTGIADTIVPDQAAMILDQFHEVYGTGDDRTRAVLVFRQNGTSIGFNDSIWERYPLGEYTKMNDPVTKAPIRRNPYWKPRPGASPESAATKLETLTARGAIVLVCNNAAGNFGSALAEMTKKDPDEVRADVRKNLIPGALLVPSGVFATIRAQNAGCAYMRG